MKIIIDGKPDLVSAEDGSRFSDALRVLSEWLKARHLAITDLVLDGEYLTSQRRDELGPLRVDLFGRLDVTTVDPLTLARQALMEVRAHLEPLAKSLAEITSDIRRSDLQAAWTKVALAFDVWSIIIEAVDKAATLTLPDVKTFEVNGERLEAGIGELRGMLEEAGRAMEDRDIAKVGDLMEHKFAPRLDAWYQIIDALCREIDRRAAERHA